VSAALLRRHSQSQVQQADDAGHISSSTRLGSFTQLLTYCPFFVELFPYLLDYPYFLMSKTSIVVIKVKF